MSRHRFLTVCAAAAMLAAAQAGADERFDDFVPVTDDMLVDPDPADWLMWRRTLDSWGYSPLEEIHSGNVGQLRLAWSRPLGPGVQEGTPLVYDGVMYFPHPSDFMQAYDAATGDLIWEYRRSWPEDLGDYIPFPSINRNIAIYGTLILHNGADNYAYALDARTGELVWETRILDYREGAQHSSGPITANGLVISGRGCEPEGGPDACVITAFEAMSGREVWRTRTIPAPGEYGDDTWGRIPYEERRHVGTWMVPSYDPQLNRVYIGTSVTSPAPKFMFGDPHARYLYHNSTLALDGDTGEIVWYFQHIVDHWDLDHPFERLLIDTAVAPDPASVVAINPNLSPGEQRRVLTGIPGKTGIVYTLDRETGEFLWARPTVEQNVVARIDPESGQATVNPETIFLEAGQQVYVCPSLNGGKNYPAGAYSPQTHAMYFPLQNTCMRSTAMSDTPSLDDLYALRNATELTPGTDQAGRIEAISVETGATLWKYEQRAGTLSLLATGGGLLFGGDMNGRFRAFDQATGEILWEVNLGSHVTGYPVTFAVNGRQYVAVSTGSSLMSMGVNSLTPELRPGTGNQLFVFALP
jgi:PQQ-dependent dehydrogenase (methanol/ethanol family)